MARKSKSVYEKIEEIRLEITSTEQTLIDLKSKLEQLLAEKDDLEMRQIWANIKSNGLTFIEAQGLINKQSKVTK